MRRFYIAMNPWLYGCWFIFKSNGLTAEPLFGPFPREDDPLALTILKELS